MYRAMPPDYQTANLEMTASRAEAEREMFQAELDYRLACEPNSSAYWGICDNGTLKGS